MKPDCESLDLKHARIVVTGGAGFLGRAVMAELATRGATDIMIPRRRDFDFTREADVARELRVRVL
ncbi:MAG: KR domain-containing protein [Planctomycetota bacterium]|nr:MAG: KR domain-containing protein [Planctomycetota bacterium]RLS94854.1 MAG: KR domain-containing protein [Planctomycetota bacterium]